MHKCHDQIISHLSTSQESDPVATAELHSHTHKLYLLPTGNMYMYFACIDPPNSS